jgi:hypothetical protein
MRCFSAQHPHQILTQNDPSAATIDDKNNDSIVATASTSEICNDVILVTKK